jgi:hypothetical protein
MNNSCHAKYHQIIVKKRRSMLPHNVGETDRAFRIVGGMLLLLYAVVNNNLPSTLQAVAVVVALLSMVTGMVGFCGFYALLGISTCPTKTVKKTTRKPAVKKAVVLAKKPVAKKTKRVKK